MTPEAMPPGRPRTATRLAIALLVCAGLPIAPVLGEEIPRTPDGRPDLTGNYDVSTLTPFERPSEYGERRYLTEEEAQAVAQREASLVERLNQPSDPDRGRPPVGGNVGGYNFIYIDRGTGMMSIDGQIPTSVLIDPPNGRLPPLTERGAARREGLYTFFKDNTGDAWWLREEPRPRGGPYDGPESLSIADRCIFSLEATIPIYSKLYNNVKTIVQTETHVIIVIEWMHEVRIIRLVENEASVEHAPAAIRSRSGDSVGWWEGDTLVVDTTNFLEESWVTATLFNEPSPPADQHVVERFTLLDGRHPALPVHPRVGRLQALPTAVSTPGRRPTTGSTSTPATRATTRWATSFVERACSRAKRRLNPSLEPTQASTEPSRVLRLLALSPSPEAVSRSLIRFCEVHASPSPSSRARGDGSRVGPGY